MMKTRIHLLLALCLVPVAGCSGEPDMTGIWHVEIEYDPGSRAVAAMRIDQAADGLQAQLFGRATASVGPQDGSFHIEFQWVSEERAELSRTIVASEYSSHTMTGTYESCNEAECYVGALHARKVEPLDEPAARGVTVVSEYNGPPSGEWSQDGNITVNVRVVDDIAYVARRFDGLRIVDLSSPASPVELGHAPVAFAGIEHYNDVKLIEGPDGRVYAIMASSVRGAVVIDVTDPRAPLEVTAFPDPAGAPNVHALFIEGTRAYLAYLDDGSLLIYDLSDPTQPVADGSYQDPDVNIYGGFVHDLYVEDGRAYLNYWNQGMVIVDTQVDPPVVVGEYTGYGDSTSHSSWVTRVGDRTIAVHGDEDLGAHVRIVDVDEQSGQFLETLGSYQTRSEVSVHNVMAHGDLAFVTYYQDGLRILDLGDPANPVLAGHLHTWPGLAPGYGQSFYEGAIGVDYDPDTRTIYVADTHRGLFVLALE